MNIAYIYHLFIVRSCIWWCNNRSQREYITYMDRMLHTHSKDKQRLSCARYVLISILKYRAARMSLCQTQGLSFDRRLL